MFEWIGQVLAALLGWFWPIVGLISFGCLVLLISILVDNGWMAFIALLIVALAVGVGIYGSYFHLKGYYLVNDLRMQFEANSAAIDASGKIKPGSIISKLSQEKLVEIRNQRLSSVGLCAYGAWWETKRTGDEPVVDTEAIYYFCNRYSE